VQMVTKYGALLIERCFLLAMVDKKNQPIYPEEINGTTVDSGNYGRTGKLIFQSDQLKFRNKVYVCSQVTHEAHCNYSHCK